MADTPCIIGEGIQIRGNLSGSGDLIVRGRIEGQIRLQDHLTIEDTGIIIANVEIRGLTVNGKLEGDIEAAESVAFSSTAKVVGDVRATQIEIADGARFRGRLDMDVPLPDDI
jgi:cytoskeletal protein CcmA (bactofilin family)